MFFNRGSRVSDIGPIESCHTPTTHPPTHCPLPTHQQYNEFYWLKLHSFFSAGISPKSRFRGQKVFPLDSMSAAMFCNAHGFRALHDSPSLEQPGFTYFLSVALRPVAQQASSSAWLQALFDSPSLEQPDFAHFLSVRLRPVAPRASSNPPYP